MGQIANTDAQYLSQRLTELGISVLRHSVVGDNPKRLREAVELDPALAGCDRLFAQSLVERMLQANAPLLPAFAES